jgi:hypothetical protein
MIKIDGVKFAYAQFERDKIQLKIDDKRLTLRRVNDALFMHDRALIDAKRDLIWTSEIMKAYGHPLHFTRE